MNESFIVERTDIKSLLSNYNLSIPPFQRKFVWNDEKKRELIDSLNMSFPIGAITLFLNKNDNCYLIVDGLQRINTIKAYLSNPCDIVPFNQYWRKIQEELTEFANQHHFSLKAINQSVKKWYATIPERNEGEEFGYKSFAHLQRCIELRELSGINADLGIFQTFRTILIKPIDVENETLALITYRGKLDNLPDLFSKINQKNVSLTGYEILHSLWYKYVIPKDAPGFEVYVSAFMELANKSDGYIKLDDNYFDSFNMYMNISSLEEIIEENTNDSVRQFLDSKTGFRALKSETVFDIFSTICKKTSNRINESVDDIFADKDNPPLEFILNLNNAIVEVAIFLNDFLCEHNIPPYSKYFYIYFFYYVFITKYSFDMERRICEKQPNATIDEEKMLCRIDEAIEGQWFINENRQLSFFVNKIKALSPQDR